MRFAQDDADGRHLIRAYGPGEITVRDTVYRESVLIMPDAGVMTWSPQAFAALRAEDFADLLQHDPELVVLGTGANQQFPAAALCAPLYARNIGMEVMDTAAACRTYNILASEGREVLAALLMI